MSRENVTNEKIFGYLANFFLTFVFKLFQMTNFCSSNFTFVRTKLRFTSIIIRSRRQEKKQSFAPNTSMCQTTLVIRNKKNWVTQRFTLNNSLFSSSNNRFVGFIMCFSVCWFVCLFVRCSLCIQTIQLISLSLSSKFCPLEMAIDWFIRTPSEVDHCIEFDLELLMNRHNCILTTMAWPLACYCARAATIPIMIPLFFCRCQWLMDSLDSFDAFIER